MPSTDDSQMQLAGLLRNIGAEFSGARCLETVRGIFRSDHRSDYQAFRQTAQYVRGRLEEAGLSNVQVIPHPADGVTRHGDWIVPQAWDAAGAELRIAAPEDMRRTVVRHADKPICIAMHSAPTPPEGIEAELVLWDDVAEGDDLTGKMVLTSERIRTVAEHAMARAAVGIVSDYAQAHAVDRNARYWENYCFVPRNTTGGFGFILSPVEGQQLRQELSDAGAQDTPLVLHAAVDTRLYDGEVDIVTGVVPGSEADGEEVLLVAHLYEVGANDNMSGAAVCIEAARSLGRLIEQGVLGRPRRSVRILLCFEQYGTVAFLDMHRKLVPRIVAGLNADMVGEDQELCGSVLQIDRTPPANPSYTNDLIARLIELQTQDQPAFAWRESCYMVHDGFISDPQIDIPTPSLIHQPDRFYHSDADTPDKVSPHTLQLVGTAATAYAYCIASAGLEEAQGLAELTASRAKRRLLDATESRLAFARSQELRAIHSVQRLVPAHQRDELDVHLSRLAMELGPAPDPAAPSLTPEQKRAHALAPERITFGSLTMADLPAEARAELAEITSQTFPYSTELCSALFWADGERSIYEVQQLLAHERDRVDLDFLVSFFRFLETHGYCRIRRREVSDA
jgi:aminopeptidase YwaD